MNKIGKNVVLLLVAGAAAAFVLAFIGLCVHHAGVVRDEQLAASTLRSRLVVSLALSHALRLFPALLLFVYTASFSVCFTLFSFHTGAFPFSRVAVPSFIVLMVFLVFTALSGFFFIPGLNKTSRSIRQRAQVARAALDRARELNDTAPADQDSSERALEALEIYLLEDPGSAEAVKLRGDILGKLRSLQGGKPSPREPVGEQRQRPATSWERGKAAYQRGDYREALYYFERALELHPGNREMEELYRRTRDKVDRQLGEITSGEREQARLVREKEQALARLDEGAYYQAYEILLELHRRYPRLRDLELYLERAESALRRVDFTAEELQRHAWLPGYPDVLFFDAAGVLNTVKRVVPWRGNYYFYQVSRYGDGGIPETWRYGKWLDGLIRLKNDEGYRRVPEGQEHRFFIQPLTGPGYLVLVSQGESADQLNLYERIEQTDNLRKSGMRIPGLWEYLSREIGVLFSVYALAMVLGGIAWSKRSIYEFPPLWKLLIFLATVPLLCFFLQRFYTGANDMLIYLHRYAAGRLAGLNVLVLAAAVNVAAALAATLFFLSRESGME